MIQAGRKSTANLAVIPLPGARTQPPSGMTKAQAAVWRAVVDSLPSNWFGPDSAASLVQYCRHVVSANDICKLIDALDPLTLNETDLIRYDNLLKMRIRESLILVKLATACRLTPQSRLAKDSAGVRANKAGSQDKPWHVE